MHVSLLNHIFSAERCNCHFRALQTIQQPVQSQKAQAEITALGFVLLSKLSMGCACQPSSLPAIFFFPDLG